MMPNQSHWEMTINKSKEIRVEKSVERLKETDASSKKNTHEKEEILLWERAPIWEVFEWKFKAIQVIVFSFHKI